MNANDFRNVQGKYRIKVQFEEKVWERFHNSIKLWYMQLQVPRPTNNDMIEKENKPTMIYLFFSCFIFGAKYLLQTVIFYLQKYYY